MQLVTFQTLPERNAFDPSETGRTLADAALGLEGLDFSLPGLHRLGAVMPPGPRAGDVVDLNRALAVKLAFEDHGAPEVEADSMLPADMLAFLRQGTRAVSTARLALAWTLDALERYDGPDLVRAGVVLSRRAVKLAAPIARPGKILGVAGNYAPHGAEKGQHEPPKEPVLFLKATSAVIGPDEDIVIPRASRKVDYEGELAVVIGQRTRNVESMEALNSVAGYTVANDVTARDFQNVRGQHFIGKSCDTFAPMGPVLVTPDEIGDPQALPLRTTVSGDLRQSASTSEMLFPLADVISFASKLMTLEPGDVILTGTPSGVGSASDPPRWLDDGDVVDVEIEGIGRLRNFVRQEQM